VFFPDVPDSDEENDFEEDEDDPMDEFMDFDFNCEIEIKRAKKTSIQTKISTVQWSG